MKNSNQVCSEFCARFPACRIDFLNETRVGFMLSHPIISSKLDEWIGDNSKPDSVVAPTPGGNCRNAKTNVKNQFIEPDGDKQSQSHQTSDAGNVRSHTAPYAKSSEQSTTQRETGNSLFKQKKYNESLNSYGEAIRYAPVFKNEGSSLLIDNSNQSGDRDSELLALSVANRSAVYYELGEDFYDESLQDVDLALAYGYPARLKHKLLLRKANIYIKKNKWELANKVMAEIQKTDVSGNGKETEGRNTYPPDVVKRINELASKIDSNILAKPDTSITEPSASSFLDTNNTSTHCSNHFVTNKYFENASESVTIGYSEQSARCVNAAKDLNKKDVIFQEDPFASVLLPNFYDSHCHHCHKILEKGYFIPCQQCAQVKFCSRLCAELAWNLYHQHECLSLDLLHSVGIAHLGIRIILCAGRQIILDAVQKHEYLTDAKNVFIFERGGSNYERVYSLMDHIHEMHVEDIFQYTLTASLLTNWLHKKTSFLHEFASSSIEEQGKIGGVLLRHICQLICNAHAITDVFSDINLQRVSLSTADESQLRIATAIYPAASLMNHSCDSNIVFKFNQGKTLLVKVMKEITKGGEVFNCYGPHFRRMPVKSRQEILQEQYFFQCACEHCVTETNQQLSFVETFSSYKCEHCEGPVLVNPDSVDNQNQGYFGTCQVCNHKMDLQDQMAACVYSDRLLQDGDVLLDRGKVDEALKIFLTCHAQYNMFLHKLHSTLGQLSDTIGRCYAILGQFSSAIKYIKESLIYVESRFGPESIEYGREIKKYADLLRLSDADSNADELIKLTQEYNSILNF